MTIELLDGVEPTNMPTTSSSAPATTSGNGGNGSGGGASGSSAEPSNCRQERDANTLASSEKWSAYVDRYTAPPGQSSPKEMMLGSAASSSTETEQPAAANHPVSSDQAARGGRGRKRKNTDINKKV